LDNDKGNIQEKWSPRGWTFQNSEGKQKNCNKENSLVSIQFLQVYGECFSKLKNRGVLRRISPAYHPGANCISLHSLVQSKAKGRIMNSNIVQAIEKLKLTFPGARFIVFGSQATGTANKERD
jgi:hypothetical protein